VGSVTAARRPILPLHHFVGGKIGRRDKVEFIVYAKYLRA